MVLAFGHALGAHEALGRPYALSGFLEVVHHLFEDSVFVGHDRSIRTGGILRSLDCFVFSRKHADCAMLRKRGRRMHEASRRGTMRMSYVVRIDCGEVSGERGVQEPTAGTCKNCG